MRLTSNDLELAAEWLESYSDEPDAREEYMAMMRVAQSLRGEIKRRERESVCRSVARVKGCTVAEARAVYDRITGD